MDQSYIDIEACIRAANQQRNEALGKLILAGWIRFKQSLTRLRYRRPPGNAVAVNPLAFLGAHLLP